MRFTLPEELGVTGWFEDEAPVRDEHWKVRAGDLVIDVGCHVGSYALPALAAGATVIAIDPDKVRLGVLARLAIVNDLDEDALILVNEALSAPGGYSREFRAALDAAPYPEHHASAQARYSTLDEVARRFALTRCDWIKVDVEGAELGVLQGGLGMLARFRPRVLMEEHTGVLPFVRDLDSAAGCRALLESLGYAVNVVRYGEGRTPVRDIWVCTP